VLPTAFLDRPLAHRALHDAQAGRPENSRAAIRAALDAGYGIEIDLQLSRDNVAMVFHDATLDRLTGARGPLRAHDAAALSALPLRNATEGIPTLAQVLAIVDGTRPLLIELKDQDGALGPDVGPLEEATANALDGYAGPVALMSFNPHSVAACARYAPGTPRGLTTCGFAARDWPGLPATLRDRLRAIPDFTETGACFVSHRWRDLASPAVDALRARGVPVLCWTVRSPAQEAQARGVADNVTFEGYTA
jgi:glycerophosphoryl diester phosphodiesterase